MTQVASQIGKSGRLVIPAAFRRALDLNEGDSVLIRLASDRLEILTPDRALAEARSLVGEYVASGRRLVDELLDERAREVSDG